MEDKIVFQLETSAPTNGSGAVQDNTKLTSSIDNLISQMSSFNNGIKDLISATKIINTKYPPTSSNQFNPKNYAQETARLRAVASNKRSDFITSEEGQRIQQTRADFGILRNEAALKKQGNIKTLLDMVQQYESSGDSKFAKSIIKDTSDTLNGVIKKGAKSKLAQVMTAIGGVGLATSSFGKLMGADVSAGNAMMQNPLTNGYNYGGQVNSLMNAQQQRQNAYVGTGTAIAGGLTSLIPGGAIVGAGIMGAGQIYGAYQSAQTSLKANAAQTYINNTMNMQSLSATNQAASGIVSNNKYNITDVQQPLILAMKRGATVYNRNFKAIDKLTDYTIATQMSIQQAGSLAGNVGMLTRGMNQKQSNEFVNKMEQSFSAYGITDYAGTANTAIGLTQAGMSPSKAIEVAARSTGLNQGMQGAMSSYYGDTISGRTIKDYIAQKLYNVSLPDIMSGKGDPVASKYRESLLKSQQAGTMPTDPMAMGFESLFNLTNLQSAESSTDMRNIVSTKDQNKFIASTNSVTAKYAEGMTMDKAIGILNAELNGSSESLKTFTSAVTSAGHALQTLISPTSYSGGKINGSVMSGHLSTKSGNTATKYDNNWEVPPIISTTNHKR